MCIQGGAKILQEETKFIVHPVDVTSFAICALLFGYSQEGILYTNHNLDKMKEQ